jgi:transposase
VNRLRNEVSNALLIPVQDAQDYVKVAPVVHSDETSFKQGNGDGKNPDQKKAGYGPLFRHRSLF